MYPQINLGEAECYKENSMVPRSALVGSSTVLEVLSLQVKERSMSS
jgi:hypothetical protein